MMPIIEATTRSSWATALAGSVGLHGLLWWAVSSAELSSESLPRTLPLAVYLLPLPAEIPAELNEPLPPEDMLDDLLAPEEPEPEPDAHAEPPAAPAVVDPSDDDRATAPANESRPPRAVPTRRDIDWNASISHAIARVREREREESYRTFGFTVPESDIQGPIGSQPDRSKPWESQRPGETISTGVDRLQVNDHCYYEVYAPGSLLAEAHRFTNSALSCKPSAPAGPRNDLFRDARPDYLDLHLAEEAANRAQPAP